MMRTTGWWAFSLRADVLRLLAAVRELRQRAAMLCAYGCGLRLSEVLALRISHIDGERPQLRVVAGKGRQDRNLPLSRRLIERLPEYWLAEKPKDLLFSSRYRDDEPLATSSLQRAFRQAAEAAGITKRVSFHRLRHYAELGIRGMPMLRTSSSAASTCG